MLLVGQQEGHMSYKKLDAMLMVTIDWSFAHLRAPVDITTYIIFSSNGIQKGDIPVQAHLEKWPLNGERVSDNPQDTEIPSFLVVTTERPHFALGGVV